MVMIDEIPCHERTVMWPMNFWQYDKRRFFQCLGGWIQGLAIIYGIIMVYTIYCYKEPEQYARDRAYYINGLVNTFGLSHDTYGSQVKLGSVGVTRYLADVYPATNVWTFLRANWTAKSAREVMTILMLHLALWDFIYLGIAFTIAFYIFGIIYSGLVWPEPGFMDCCGKRTTHGFFRFAFVLYALGAYRPSRLKKFMQQAFLITLGCLLVCHLLSAIGLGQNSSDELQKIHYSKVTAWVCCMVFLIKLITNSFWYAFKWNPTAAAAKEAREGWYGST